MATNIEVKRELITPAIAIEYLKLNKNNNRVLRPVDVTFLADQMEKGQWQEDTTETIKFADTGNLIDGQNRLNALIKSNKSFYFWVARGLDEKAFIVLDTGKKRNGSDSLHILGAENATTVSAGISSYFLLMRENVIGNAGVNRKHYKITNQDIVNEFLTRPEFWNTKAAEAKKLYREVGQAIVPGFIVGWSVVLESIDEKKGAEFMNKLCKGVGFATEKDPVLQLRNLFTRQKTSKQSWHGKVRNKFMVETWNHFYNDNGPRLLNFNVNRPTPKLAGLDLLKQRLNTGSGLIGVLQEEEIQQ